MPAQNSARPIIRKKIVVQEAGHHGGAWKVAYADFVTAMMAFFMLMWLLGATTEKQRKGIADYFNPTIPVHRSSGGGDGAFGGDSVFTENILAQNGTGAALDVPTDRDRAAGRTGNAEDGGEDQGAEKAVESALLALTGESNIAELIRKHVVTELSDEGLRIEIYATPDQRLFTPGDGPEDVLATMLGAMVEPLSLVTNNLSVEAHVAAPPIVLRDRHEWPSSLNRAASARDLLAASGFPEDRFESLSGHADREPAVADRMSPRNERVVLVLHRS